jgi:AraC-like DNA-binding protein
MTNDSTHKLSKRADGSYIGEIQAVFDSVNFKFTRGTWESVESRWDGGMCSNRIYIVKQSSNNVIIADIKSWNDLFSGMAWLKAIFLAFFLLSIFMLSLLIRYYRATVLIALIAIVALAFLTKFFYVDYKLFQLLPQMRFLPAIIYAFIGPWMYPWFKSAITKEPIRINYIHLLPTIPLLWFLQFLTLPAHVFYLKVVNNEFVLFFFGSYAYALALQLFFSYKMRFLIAKRIAEIPELTSQLYKAIQTNLYLTIFLLFTGGICIWKNIEIKFIVDWIDNLLWFGVGIVIVFYAWSFLNYIYSDFAKNKVKSGIEDLGQDRWLSLKVKLIELMETKAVYTNPGLMLSDVAKYIGTNSHYVSKLINEEFNKSFTDYINTLRIEAFIESVQSDKANNTFLFHAFKVGFNSKSAFNRSFKNYTNKTPREYFSRSK